MALHNYIYIKHKEDSLVNKIARDHDPRPVCIQPTKLDSKPMEVEYSEDDSDLGDCHCGCSSGCSHNKEYNPSDEPIIEYREKVDPHQPAKFEDVQKKVKTVMKDGKMRKLKSRTASSKVNKSTHTLSPTTSLSTVKS